jgi:hypothetical protein
MGEMPLPMRLVLPFTLRGTPGRIDASVGFNRDPDAIGYSLLTAGATTDFARGFPVCEATVSYPAAGYAAVFGWTQMVASTDSSDGRFEMDPIAIYANVATPFAWYGINPVLFDAPSRESRFDMSWSAHSFLCVSPDAVITQRVQAVAGFAWGFDVRDGVVSIAPLASLDDMGWGEHLSLLRDSYPSWSFDSEFVSASS